MGSAGQQANDTAVDRGRHRAATVALSSRACSWGLPWIACCHCRSPCRRPPCIRWTMGGGLILIGAAIMAAGIRNFSHAATPVPSNRPVRALVTTGIHGWSRNPIYVGMFLLYAGIGIAARSPWVLILALPLVIILRYGVVAREETYLERRFGDAYRDYKARVRRWL